MNIDIPKETRPFEYRVDLSPDTCYHRQYHWRCAAGGGSVLVYLPARQEGLSGMNVS